MLIYSMSVSVDGAAIRRIAVLSPGDCRTHTVRSAQDSRADLRSQTVAPDVAVGQPFQRAGTARGERRRPIRRRRVWRRPVGTTRCAASLRR